MVSPIYWLVGVILLLASVGRVVFRNESKATDWALETAFIRLDFPPQYRAVAQQLAAGLAEVVGIHIKQLTPDHNLAQIADWADDRIYAKDLITLFVVAFDVRCDANTTFRDLVHKVAEKKARDGVESKRDRVSND